MAAERRVSLPALPTEVTPHGGRIATRELIYTGITRARKAFTLVTPQPEVFTQGLAQRTHPAIERAAGAAAGFSSAVPWPARLNPEPEQSK